MITDPVLLRIGETVLRGHAGESQEARLELRQLWDEIGGDSGDPLQRCTLAHSLADLQGDPADELAWDLRALTAAAEITDEHTARAGVELPAAALYPSLYLNLAECYRKLGDPGRAREYLALTRDTIGTLGDDEYGELIRDGLRTVAEQLDGI
ncbi:hypothetical protein [Nocardia sp. NPDC057227]|uniref:hypothetical protein n=1 Tax=Nocardia sp. NPDC057227 TaxID=3346056 RepID=UPI003640A090